MKLSIIDPSVYRFTEGVACPLEACGGGPGEEELEILSRGPSYSGGSTAADHL